MRYYLGACVWIIMVALAAMAIGCGDEDSNSGDDNDCGEHSSTGRDGLCVCEAGYDWCTSDPADFDCCPVGGGGPVCGNGVCEAGETSASCSGDCPPTGPVCGDGTCEGGETAGNCAADCGSSGPVCGNGSCESGETSANCAADCGPSGPVCGNQLCETGETSNGCPSDCPCSAANPDSCSGDNICIDSRCVGAFGRIYRLTVTTGTVPERNGDVAWDALGGLPDPFVEISTENTIRCTTSTRQDTLSPSWNEFCDITVSGGSTLGLDMWDEDLSVHELIMACNVSLTAAQLRSGTGSCSNDGGAKVLRFTIVPR